MKFRLQRLFKRFCSRWFHERGYLLSAINYRVLRLASIPLLSRPFLVLSNEQQQMSTHFPFLLVGNFLHLCSSYSISRFKMGMCCNFVPTKYNTVYCNLKGLSKILQDFICSI